MADGCGQSLPHPAHTYPRNVWDPKKVSAEGNLGDWETKYLPCPGIPDTSNQQQSR